MNNRLKELYRSCRSKESLASQDEFNSDNVLLGLEIEKFAELIVRECIVAVEKTPTRHAYTTFDLSMIKGTIEKCVDSIKKEFDIK
jgi:hypothetical protein